MATAGDQRGAGPERAFHPDLAVGTTITLSGEESAHLVRVRRVRAGEAVVCFDGRGQAVRGTLEDADPRAARIALDTPYPSREPAVALTVLTSVPEPARADGMISALAELGVTAWVPLRCARTPPKRMELVARRRTRWERAAREACKVNGRATALRLLEPAALADVLDEGGWLLDPDPAVPSLGATPRSLSSARVLVGPEGGFSPEEIAQAQAAGLARASLGRCVLRTATAAVAAAAVFMARSEA